MLKILTLGGLSILRDTENITARLPKKGQALLVYLAYSGREQSRDYLATLLWDTDQDQAANSLRAMLTALRKELTPYLYSNRQNIWLENTQTDVRPFQNNQIDADALAAYHGEFMQGFSLNGAEMFDQWLFEEREWLNVRLNQVLVEQMREALAAHNYVYGVQLAMRALQFDPYNEDVLRQAMLLYARAGNRQDALELYTLYEQRFADELGETFSDETHTLARQIRQPTSYKIATQTMTLPYKGNAFVGRTHELATLSTYLRDPDQYRLITITGMGGAGKTRLASQLARDNADAFPDGVHFVALESVDSSQTVLGAIVDVLQLPVFGNVQQQVIHFLRGKKLLLILDNFEQVVDAATETVLTLLRYAPQLKLVITSRERLNTQQEWVFPLEGLPLEAPAVSHAPAIELFMTRAQQVNYEFIYSDAVRHICQLVEGSPLAIELAASWMGMFSAEQIRQKLENDLDFLSTTLRDLPARHRSMRAVYNQSLQLLDNHEKNTLATLALFRGEFSYEAAHQVAGIHEHDLTSLIEKSLVSVVEADRYQLHPIIRTYSYALLEQMPHFATAQEAFVKYYVQMAGVLGPRLFQLNPTTWFHVLNRENSNLRLALKFSLDLPPTYGLSLLNHLTVYLTWQVSLGDMEIYDLCQQIIAYADAQQVPHDTLYMRALLALSGSDWWLGNFDKALHQLLICYDIERQYPNDWLHLWNLFSVGSLYLSQGDMVQGLAYLDRAADMSIAAADPQWLATYRGYVEQTLAESKLPFERLPIAPKLMLMMGDPQHIPMNTYTMFLLIYQNDANLGNIHKLDDTRLHSGIIHYDLAQVALAQGNLLWALWRLLAALIVFYAFEHHTAIQLTLQSLADTLRQSDQPHLAEQCEHLATQLDMPSVTNLIFDIRELLFATN